jgi:hypothetical protein
MAINTPVEPAGLDRLETGLAWTAAIVLLAGIAVIWGAMLAG